MNRQYIYALVAIWMYIKILQIKTYLKLNLSRINPFVLQPNSDLGVDDELESTQYCRIVFDTMWRIYSEDGTLGDFELFKLPRTWDILQGCYLCLRTTMVVGALLRTSATIFRHIWWSPAALWLPNLRCYHPIFFCFPLFLCPSSSTVPCKMFSQRPFDLTTCPNHSTFLFNSC